MSESELLPTGKDNFEIISCTIEITPHENDNFETATYLYKYEIKK